jgi:predicted Zn-dependent protease
MTSRRSREAITQYEALTRLKPNNVSAINNLAILYQQEKDARALATAEKALKLAPDQPSIQDTLGWILVEEGQELPHALDLLAKAAAKLPKEATVRYHYAFALAQAGKKTEAIKELEATIGSGQKFPDLAKAQALIKSL